MEGIAVAIRKKRTVWTGLKHCARLAEASKFRGDVQIPRDTTIKVVSGTSQKVYYIALERLIPYVDLKLSELK